MRGGRSGSDQISKLKNAMRQSRLDRHLPFGDVQVEFPVQPEAADAAKAIALRIEEPVEEELARFFLGLGRARPQARVDLRERLFVRCRSKD